MRRFLFGIALMAMGSGLLTGCLSNDDDNKGSGSSELVVTKGALVLCGGNAVADVPSSLYYLDYEAGTSRAVASDLGADANDVIEYDGKVYVTGSGEDVIYVLSADNFQLLDRISTTEEMGEEAGDGPRCLTAYDGKLYVTTRGGFVGIFDTNTRGYVNKIEVGKEPEGLYLGGCWRYALCARLRLSGRSAASERRCPLSHLWQRCGEADSRRDGYGRCRL